MEREEPEADGEGGDSSASEDDEEWYVLWRMSPPARVLALSCVLGRHSPEAQAAKLKKIASGMGREVKRFWEKIDRIVEFKNKTYFQAGT